MRRVIQLATSLIFLIQFSYGQSLDASFDVRGGIAGSKSGGVRDIEQYAEGYLIAGHFDSFQGSAFQGLVKVDAAGAVDEKFLVRFEPAIVNDIEILSDRSIIAVGGFQRVEGIERFGIVKILPDGTVDEKFAPKGITEKGVLRKVMADDKEEALYVGGQFDVFNDEPWNNIVKLKLADGNTDTFNPRGTKDGTGVYDLYYYDGQDRLMIAGDFLAYDDQEITDLVRVFTDGSIDDSFKSPVIKGAVYAIDISAKDMSLLAGGAFTDVEGEKAFSLAMFDANGSYINTFNPKGFDGTAINDVKIPANGPIVITGDFSRITGLSRNNICLINPNNGEAVAAIGPGSGLNAPGYVVATSIQTGYMIGGDHTTYDCSTSNGASLINLEDAGSSAIVLDPLDLNAPCSGDSFTMTFVAAGNFCNNIFRVELSNASGNFANATVIGSVAGDNAVGKNYFGTVDCTIPVNTPQGTGYRLRVVGTSPAAISGVSTPFSIEGALGNPGVPSGNVTPCVGDVETYTTTAVAGAKAYQWIVPNGSTILSGQGTTSITVQIGSASGAIRVRARSDCYTGTYSNRAINVVQPPATNLGNVFGPTTLCVGITSNYVFDGSGGNYQWTVPTGVNITSGQGTSSLNVRATASAIDGTISVKEVNVCGESEPSTVDVSIFQMTNPGPIVVSNAAPCPDEVVNLSVNAVGATNANWLEFDGITILNETATDFSFITNGNSGTITYGFTFGQCGTSGTLTTNITSDAYPGGMGTLSIPTTICENESGVNISVPPVTGATNYVWTLPSDATITSGDGTESIVANFGLESGLLSVYAENACGPGGSQEVGVNLLSSPDALSPITGPGTVCENDGASYSVVRPLRSGLNYAWTLPIGATFGSDPNSNAVEVNFGSNGGMITVAAQNNCGVGPASELPIVMEQLPVVGQISGASNPCANSTGVQYTIPTVPGATGYTWRVTGGLELVGQSGNTAIVNVGSTSGVLSVQVDNNCGFTSESLNITPAPFPDDAGPISGTIRMCPEQSGMKYFIDPIKNAEKYLWQLPDGATITAGDATASITVDFTTTDGLISVTPQNGCGDGGSSEISVVFDPLPSGNPVIGGETNPCPSGVYTYAIEPVTNASNYTWSIPVDATIISGGGTSVNVRIGKTDGIISVTPSNKCGTGTLASTAIMVDLPPSISDISGPLAVCEGTMETYMIDPIADARNYKWNGPADAVITPGGNENEIQVLFGQEAGDITVEVSDACGSSTNTLSIELDFLPGAAGVISGDRVVCEMEQGVPYTILPVANATSYNWTGPSGSGVIGNGSNSVTVDFNEADGVLSVQPANNCGTGNSSSINVSYYNLGEATPIVGPQQACSNTTQTYSTDPVVGATNYVWNVPNDAFILSGQGTNVVEVSLGLSSGTIEVTPEGDCGPGITQSIPITIEDVTAVAGEPQFICGDQVSLAGFLGDGEAGTWSVINGNGSFSDINNAFATVSNLAEGTNEFLWTVTNGTCTSSSSVLVQATYPVTPTVSINVGANPICSGELTSFSSRVTNGGSSPTFLWRKNGVMVGGDSPTYTDAGLIDNDQITLEVTSSEVCVTSATATSNMITMAVNTTVNPVVAIAAVKNPICADEALALSVVDSTGGGPDPDFQWFKNSAFLGTGFQIVDNNTASGDEYYAEMTTSSACASTSNATSSILTATVDPVPTVNTANSYQTCTDQSVVNLSGSFAGASGVVWSSDGEGVFSNPNAANTQYTLQGNDFMGSFLTLTMRTTGNGACSPVEVFNTLEVNASPTVAMGGDIQVCADVTNVRVSTDVQFSSGYTWTTNGTGTFSPSASNIASPTYIPSADDISNGGVTLTVTASAFNCSDVTNSLDITFLDLPIADAGADQSVCSGQATLNATPVAGGETGVWQLISGRASFNSTSDPLASLTGLAVGNNVFEWLVDDGVCSNSDLVTINRGIVTPAQTIADKTVCTDTAFIGANTPLGTESGQWSLVSGTGTFDNNASSGTYVSGLTPNASSSFRWTITRGNCTSSDVITITQVTPTTANAGPDLEICTNSTTISGNAVAVGEAPSWFVNSGSATVVSPGASSSDVNDIAEEENELVYAITRGSCVSYDTLLITNNQVVLPTIQASSICGDQGTLSAPALEVDQTGSWSVLSGAGDFVDAALPTTDVNNMDEGLNSFQWDVFEGSCTASLEQNITVEFITTPTASITVGTNPICNGENTSFTAVVTETGAVPTYQWRLNGSIVGNNSLTYSNNAIVDGDQITFELLSTKNCVTTNTVTSNAIDMVVANNVVPNTEISFTNDSICIGDAVTFTVVDSTGGGADPIFEWFRNGDVLLGENNFEITLADLSGEEEVFARMTTSSSCATKVYDSSSVATIQAFSIPNANAGVDLTTCTNNVQLNAGLLQNGQIGTWSIYQGQASLTDVNNTTPNVSELSEGISSYIWTVNYNNITGCEDKDTVLVDRLVAFPDAGLDQTVREDSARLEANDPSPYTGTWSLASGSGLFEVINDSTVDVKGMAEGDNSYVWTINAQSCAFRDTVIVTYQSNFPFADAGPDQSICVDNTLLEASAPQFGETGFWTLVSGSASIDVPSSPTSTLTNIGAGKTILAWTVDNGLTTTDTVVISYQVPIIAVQDLYSVTAGDSIQIDVLTNDTTSGGDFLTVDILRQPLFGKISITVDENTYLTFTSNDPTILGNDTVTYRVANQCNAADTGTVVVQTLNTGPKLKPLQIIILQGSSGFDKYPIALLDINQNIDTSSFNILRYPQGLNQKPRIFAKNDSLFITVDLSLSPNYFGEDTITYEICDVFGECDNSYVLLKVGKTITENEGTVFPPVVTAYEGISPNGDGLNDTWYVNNIDGVDIKGNRWFGGNKVRIFNRWGDMVYSKDAYSNDDEPWDGTNKGQELPDGVYYYTIDLGIEVNGVRVVKGFILLKK